MRIDQRAGAARTPSYNPPSLWTKGIPPKDLRFNVFRIRHRSAANASNNTSQVLRLTEYRSTPLLRTPTSVRYLLGRRALLLSLVCLCLCVYPLLH